MIVIDASALVELLRLIPGGENSSELGLGQVMACLPQFDGPADLSQRIDDELFEGK